MRRLLDACVYLSWVDPVLGRRLSRVASAAMDLADAVAGTLQRASLAVDLVADRLMEVEEALIEHDPERLEAIRRARECVAEWRAREASKAEGRGGEATTSASPSMTPVRESAADGALGDASASRATSACLELAPGIDLASASSVFANDPDWPA
jgi:hypothetical protein